MESWLDIALYIEECVLNKLNQSPFVELDLSEKSHNSLAVKPAGSLKLSNSSFERTHIALDTFSSRAFDVQTNRNNAPKSGIKRASTISQPPKAPKRPAIISNQNPAVTFSAPKSAPITQLFAECFIEGQKAFMCIICAYKTNVNSNIYRHARTKHGDKLPSYKCTSCDFSSPEKNKLKNHYMMVHNLDEVLSKMATDMAQLSP